MAVIASRIQPAAQRAAPEPPAPHAAPERPAVGERRYSAPAVVGQSGLAAAVLALLLAALIGFSSSTFVAPPPKTGDVVTRQEAAARQTAFAALAMLDLSLVRDAEVPKAVANMGLQPREQNALLQRLGVPAPTPIPTEADPAHAPAVGNPPEAPAARAAPAGDPPAGAAGPLPGAQPAPSAQPAPRAQTAAPAQAAPLTQPGPSARPAPSAQPAVRETARLSLAWITLWDTDAEDGDVVRIDSGGYSRTITLSKQPVTIAVPVPHDSVISVTGIRDGEGGGITVGLASGASRAVFPIMSVGQTLGLRAQFN